MTENPPAGFDLRGLRNAVDAYVDQARLREDADGPPDPELQAYETRLSSLQYAIVVIVEYKAGFKES